MDFITYLQQTLIAQLPEMIKSYEGEIEATSLSAMEKCVKQMTFELGNEIIQQWLEAQAGKYPDDEQDCPHCGGQSSYVRRREGMSITLQGRIYFRRHYYVCSDCHEGFYPLDRKLGIQAGQMSEEVVQLAALFGIEDAFGTSQDLLKRSTSLELSPNSIRKATQRMSEKVMSVEAQLLEQSKHLETQRQRHHLPGRPHRLYGSMDGFKVLFEDGWHDMKAGVWWTAQTNKQGDLKADNLRYYTDFLPASEFSDLVWATGFKQKADVVNELVFVADGGSVRDTCKKVTSLTPKQCPQPPVVSHVVWLERKSWSYPKSHVP